MYHIASRSNAELILVVVHRFFITALQHGENLTLVRFLELDPTDVQHLFLEFVGYKRVVPSVRTFEVVE